MNTQMHTHNMDSRSFFWVKLYDDVTYHCKPISVFQLFDSNPNNESTNGSTLQHNPVPKWKTSHLMSTSEVVQCCTPWSSLPGCRDHRQNSSCQSPQPTYAPPAPLRRNRRKRSRGWPTRNHWCHRSCCEHWQSSCGMEGRVCRRFWRKTRFCNHDTHFPC